ncbi:MAG TPA: DUF1461 domain-containing protein [Patescibacteria group bacterium]|nr:DUF1461 domain-containing protein [Patescibacteria group bacterium]
MPGRLWAFLVAAATALVILGASILPFTTPAYVRLEQDRTGVGSLTGYSGGELDLVTNQILADLFLWRGDFSVGDADLGLVLNEREQGHMRDVRGVFAGFELLVLASVVVLALAFRRRPDSAARAALWRAVGSGGRGLVVAIAVAGAFAVFAFDAAFEVFHRLFFSAGSYTFDPRTDRLVQLFPEQFWSETAIAVGAVAIVVAILTALLAARRAGAARLAPVLSTSEART